MNETKGLYMVMYDITHPAALQKVARLLQKAGYERMNYSVWIGWQNPLSDPMLRQQLQKLVLSGKAGGSLLYILPVSRHMLSRMLAIDGKKPENIDYWTGTRRNLFF